MAVAMSIVARALALLIQLAAALSAPPALASDGIDWRRAAETDLTAARDLLRGNHPAGHPALGKTEFLDWLDKGHAEGMARAATVTDFAGYLAVLQAYALGFGDGHIRVQPVQDRRVFQWPGFLVALKGGRWVVADTAESGPGLPPLGATLTACDGRDPETLAWEKMGRFTADLTLEAQRVSTSPALLVDAGNLFVPRPAACALEAEGRAIAVTLDWRPIAAEELSRRTRAALPRAANAFGLRAVGDGWWIGLPALSNEAEGVLKAVEGRLEEIRKAPFVVVDLRGNGGGNSAWTTRLAETLYGRDHVRARMPRTEGTCDPRWRVSADNLKTVESYQTTMAAALGRMGVTALGRTESAMRAALKTGEPFVPTLSERCTMSDPPEAPSGRSAMAGRVLLVTDHVCFSSCLIATDEFRRLGAIHVGGTTNAAQPFTEVRAVTLPSGHARFATMQAWAPGLEGRRGPFVPDHPYPGDLADTAALELWLQAQLLPSLERR